MARTVASNLCSMFLGEPQKTVGWTGTATGAKTTETFGGMATRDCLEEEGERRDDQDDEFRIAAVEVWLLAV